MLNAPFCNSDSLKLLSHDQALFFANRYRTYKSFRFSFLADGQYSDLSNHKQLVKLSNYLIWPPLHCFSLHFQRRLITIFPHEPTLGEIRLCSTCYQVASKSMPQLTFIEP
jgi:hypothetical protein